MKQIPITWLIAFLMAALVVLRALGIDSWTTASLGILVGYLTGNHIGQLAQNGPTTSVAVPPTA